MQGHGGLYLPRVIPYGIHVESMESISNSIWNPWNECWLRAQLISYSMDIMDSMWNGHGMINSTWIPHGFHMDPTGFHMECRHIHLGFHGTVHMDSMEQIPFHGNSAGIPENQPYLINKNSSNAENRTPASGRNHVMYWMSTFSAALCSH